MTPSVTERTARVNGIELHLAEAGPADGPPVVLLHGFPDSWKLWRHQVAADHLGEGGFRIDGVMRRIPDHFHAHARDPNWAGFAWGRGPSG